MQLSLPGVVGIASLLGGAMRAFRLSGSPRRGRGVHELAATFLAPALFLWAAWALAAARRDNGALAAARRDNVRRLYFVARDAHLVWRVARLLAPQFGGIDCRYLKISRKSILLAASGGIGPDTMTWLRPLGAVLCLRELVEKLGAPWQQVGQAFAAIAKDSEGNNLLTEERDWTEFWRIAQSPTVADHVRQQIDSQRASAIAYLRAEGLFDGERSALVDIGWHLTMQSGVQELLGGPTSPAAMSGYYLGLRRNRMPPAVAGQASGLYHEDMPDRSSVRGTYAVFERLNLLEHVFGLAPHGTVREYKVAGATAEAICTEVDARHLDLVRDVQAAVEAFCESNKADAGLYGDGSQVAPILDALIRTWFAQPAAGALAAFSHIVVANDPDNIDSRRLLEAWRPWDAVKMLIPVRLHSRLGIKVRRPPWPEAAGHLQRRARVSYIALAQPPQMEMSDPALFHQQPIGAELGLELDPVLAVLV